MNMEAVRTSETSETFPISTRYSHPKNTIKRCDSSLQELSWKANIISLLIARASVIYILVYIWFYFSVIRGDKRYCASSSSCARSFPDSFHHFESAMSFLTHPPPWSMFIQCGPRFARFRYKQQLSGVQPPAYKESRFSLNGRGRFLGSEL